MPDTIIITPATVLVDDGEPHAMAKFEVTRLAIPDVLLVRPTRFGDARGYFMESYNRAEYSKLGIACDFVQDNQAMSEKRGTIRGLHFQRPPTP